METLVFNGNWTALSPIHHGGSNEFGNTKLILTLPMIIKNHLNNNVEIDYIPTIHGNAVRGYLRRLLMDDFLTCLDYKLDSKKVYHFLFTGGILESLDNKDKGSINLSLKKELRDFIPPISLLGSALGNQMIQGKLKVGMGYLVCDETKHYFNNSGDIDVFSAYNLKNTDFGIRLDDLKDSSDDEVHQMKYEFETLIMGSRFFHQFVLEDCNDVEKSCFSHMFQLWCERPYIGGKSSVGYGKLSLDYPNINILDNKTYLNYLEDNKEDITNCLDRLVETWK